MSTTDSLDVRGLIDAGPLRPLQYWIIATCIVIAIMDGYDTAVIGFAGPSLIAQGLVDAKSFGYVASSGLAGFVPGMLLFGPAADRLGRKPVLIAAVLIFAAGSLLSAVSSGLPMLMLSRLVTGVGVGGAAPCFVALAAEYAPQRLRTTVVTTLWAGVPAGGILGGLVSSQVSSSAGWPTLFYFGAVAPVVALALLVFTVPESLEYLAAKGGSEGHIRAIISRIAPEGLASPGRATFLPRAAAQKSTVEMLFRNGAARVTLPLWLAFFCAFGHLVMISQYAAVLLRSTGMPPGQISTVFSFFFVGSVIGTVAAGPIMNRTAHTGATIALLVSAAAAAVLFGYLSQAFVSALIGISIAGFAAAAAVGALVALATDLYPLPIRATGVGWGLALSRVGATVTPLLSGMLVSWNVGHIGYYAVAACIALVGAASVLSIHVEQRRRAQPPIRSLLGEGPRRA